MMAMLPIVLPLLVGFLPTILSQFTHDYFEGREPAIDLNVYHLELRRRAKTYQSVELPATNGFIELRCDVPQASLQSDPDTKSKHGTLTWELPNGNIIENGRAHEMHEEEYGIYKTYLAITNFTREDAGDYTCRLNVDGEPSRYGRTIHISALDGTAIISCHPECQKNQENKCQVMERLQINCEAYGDSKPRFICDFRPCENETDWECNLASIADSDSEEGDPGFVYKYSKETVVDKLALKSGRYQCQAVSAIGSSLLSIFVPVSAGEKKFGRPAQPWMPTTESEGGRCYFLGKRFPNFYKLGEEVSLSCWTNDKSLHAIQWTYRNASSPNNIETITNGSILDVYIHEEDDVSDGMLSQIVFKSATMEYGGWYECSSERGSTGTKISKELEMETYRWSDEADVNEDRQETRTVGGSITMKCTVVATRKDPEIKWYKDGVTLQASDNVAISLDHQTLTISNLTLSDGGIYTCVCDCSSRAPYYSLLPEDLKGKTTLIVKDASDPSLNVESVNNAISSLEAVKQSLTNLAQDLINN